MTITPEIWLPLAGFESQYEVSSLGQVRSRPRPRARARILKPSPTGGKNYLAVNIGRRTMHVHVLVAQTFHGPRPQGMVVRHLNGDATDNRAENVVWGTPAENAQDQFRLGRIAALNRTHCPKGHPYDQTNTRINEKGHRRCITCDRAKSKSWYYRRGKELRRAS